jgi:hypothetical protein
MRSGKRRTGVLTLGLLLLIAGVVGGIALLLTSARQYDDAVAGLARAPVGCDTTLDFPEAGTYLIFIETKGRSADVRGDCASSNRDYERSAAELPVVAQVLTANGGDQVELEQVTGLDYDRAGYAGVVARRFVISDAGEYILRVTSVDDNFAVSVGRDPETGAKNLRIAGLATIIGGGALGLILVLLGLRRRPAPAPVPIAAGGAYPWHVPGATRPPVSGPPMPPTTVPPTVPRPSMGPYVPSPPGPGSVPPPPGGPRTPTLPPAGHPAPQPTNATWVPTLPPTLPTTLPTTAPQAPHVPAVTQVPTAVVPPPPPPPTAAVPPPPPPPPRPAETPEQPED